MAVPISELDGGKAIEVVVTEKLHKEDYATFVPPIEKSIGDNGKVRLLFEMLDFHGWDTAAVWEDIKFDARNFTNFERIAMAGDKPREKWMAGFCKPFTTGKIKYFDRAEKEEAKRWLLAES
jgi:hypothetical protein